MIDKLVMLKPNEVTVIYTHRPPFTVTSDTQSAVELLSWLVTPTMIRLSDYKAAVDSAAEVTQEIKVAA